MIFFARGTFRDLVRPLNVIATSAAVKAVHQDGFPRRCSAAEDAVPLDPPEEPAAALQPVCARLGLRSCQRCFVFGDIFVLSEKRFGPFHYFGSQKLARCGQVVQSVLV